MSIHVETCCAPEDTFLVNNPTISLADMSYTQLSMTRTLIDVVQEDCLDRGAFNKDRAAELIGQALAYLINLDRVLKEVYQAMNQNVEGERKTTSLYL